MAKDGKSMATPRLRFPDFRKAEKWNVDSLSVVATFVNEKTPVSNVSTTDYVSTDNLLPDYGGMAAASKLPPTGSVTRYQVDDVLISNIRPYLKKVWHADRNGGASNDVIVVRAKTQLSKAFLSLILKNDSFIAYVMRGAKGLKMPRGDTNSIAEYPVGYPLEREQQKIADCLTSLDDVIAAQARKVEALKAHKCGLMQRLFPREGETVPRLRFPEFRDGSEWKETRLNQLGKLISGLTYSPSDVREEGLLVLRSSNIQNAEVALRDCVYVTPNIKGANLSKPHDILICVRNGSKALIGKSAMIPKGMPICTHGAFMTVFRAHTPYFVFQLMQSALFQKQVAADLGATINSINGSQLLRYRFVVPDLDEQLQIADCLSSLDVQIAAESRKLDALKSHKRGLMQQLFLSPAED